MVKPDCSSEKRSKLDLCYMTIKPVIEMVPNIRVIRELNLMILMIGSCCRIHKVKPEFSPENRTKHYFSLMVIKSGN